MITARKRYQLSEDAGDINTKLTNLPLNTNAILEQANLINRHITITKSIPAPPILPDDPQFLNNGFVIQLPHDSVTSNCDYIVNVIVSAGYMEREKYMYRLLISYDQVNGYKTNSVTASLLPTTPIIQVFPAVFNDDTSEVEFLVEGRGEIVVSAEVISMVYEQPSREMLDNVKILQVPNSENIIPYPTELN